MTAALHGKVALVIGAAQAPGRALALGLAAQGAAVIVGMLPAPGAAAQAAALVADIAALGGRALPLQAGACHAAAIEAMLAQAGAAFGGLDIVVSMGGDDGAARLMCDVTEQEYDSHIALHAKVPFFVLQQAARVLRRGGRIIHVVAGAGALARAGHALACGANAACIAYAKVLSREIGARAITVNVVVPGPAGSLGPLDRAGTPADLADVVGLLASEQAGWITGQAINACGGLFA